MAPDGIRDIKCVSSSEIKKSNPGLLIQNNWEGAGCVDKSQEENVGMKKRKPIRRAKMNKRVSKQVTILYSNIQGFLGKQTSIEDIIKRVNCDICLNGNNDLECEI